MPYGEGDRREQAGRRPPGSGVAEGPAGLSAAGSECVEVVDAALVEELTSPLLLPPRVSLAPTCGGRGRRGVGRDLWVGPQIRGHGRRAGAARGSRMRAATIRPARLRVRVRRPYVVAVGQVLMSVMAMLDADDARCNELSHGSVD